MDTAADFRRIECVCGKRIRVANQINVLSLQCPRCGKTLPISGGSTERASGLPRGFFIALLAAIVALGCLTVFTAKGCIASDRKEAAEAKANATLAEATDWLKQGIKADSAEGSQIEKKLTQSVLDPDAAKKEELQKALEDIGNRLATISEYTQTRQLLLNAKSILQKGSLEPATLMEMRRFLDSYLQADAESRDPADARDANKMLAEIDLTTDPGRIRVALDALDEAAFLDAARTPPMDGLTLLHPSLKDYHRKWVFQKVYSRVSDERDKRRRDKEHAKSIKAEDEKQRQFAVRPDFDGDILGEDPFVYQLGEWTYMLTGGKRISVLRSRDLVVWEDRGELLKGSKIVADFPGSLSKPECIAEVDCFAIRCEASKPGHPTEQYVLTAYVKTLDPKEIAPDDNLLRVQKDGGGRLDRSVTLNGKKWRFGVEVTDYPDHYSRDNRTKSGRSLTCVNVTCDSKPRPNLYKSLDGYDVQDLGTLVLAEYLQYSDLGGVHPFLDSNEQLFLAHHFSDTERRGRKTICIRPIVFAADGWPLAGEPLSKSRKWKNNGDPLKMGNWMHIHTCRVVPRDLRTLHATGALSKLNFESDGTIGGRKTGSTWKQKGEFLTLEFPKPASDTRIPDANYIDECVVGGEGTWYVGRNQFGGLIRGVWGVDDDTWRSLRP